MIGTSLFAGPGGMDLAAEAHSIRTIGIEWDTNTVATRIAARLTTIHGDVTQYGPADLPARPTARRATAAAGNNSTPSSKP